MDDAAYLVPADEITLAEHAAVIRALGKRIVTDVIEIGRRLHACKEQVGHGGWLPWLEREFGWAERTAQNFMSVADLAAKSATVADLSIPMKGLYLLAAPSTPAEVTEAVIERAEAGDTPTAAEIKQMIADAKGDAEKRLQRERQHFEGKLGEARRAIDAREAEVRAEYADKLILDPETVQQMLAERTAPLSSKIERYEKRLRELTEREERRKAQKPAPDKPPIDGAALTASTGIAIALESLAPRLITTPAEIVAVEQRCLSATGQTLQQRVGAMLRNAETVRSWLDGFCQAASTALQEETSDERN
jgi:hypothetical protein